MEDHDQNQVIACSPPTKQLWSMTPIGAAWTESMQLGGQLHGAAIEEFYRDMYATNVELNSELGATQLHLQFARESMEQLRAVNRSVMLSLQEANQELELLRKEREENQRALQDANQELDVLRKERDARDELEKLACDIWGPATRSRPDATWDPPPVLLSPEPKGKTVNPGRHHGGATTTTTTTGGTSTLSCVNPTDPPVTVGKIAAEMGFRSDAQHVHRLGGFVREAFMRAHGRSPEPHIYYDETGMPVRICCFTERDRELIAGVVLQHGVR